MLNKKPKSSKKYNLKNSVITVERIYSEEKKVKDLLKEYLQNKDIKSYT